MRPERIFATFRIAGDNLVPSRITAVLGLKPTHAYAKGERYSAGARSGDLIGRTGVWYFSTDRHVESNALRDHLAYLADNFVPNSAKLDQLKRLLEENSLKAVVTCFWDGPAGARPPGLSAEIIEKFRRIPAEIEQDFDTDEEPPSHKRAATQASK